MRRYIRRDGGILGFVPGVQVISGLYFTGRIAYQVYDEINKSNYDKT